MTYRMVTKPTTKGQITLPQELRRLLKITRSTYLGVGFDGGRIIIEPLKIDKARSYPLREYSDADINRFLKADKLDKKTAAWVQKVTGKK